MTRHRTVLNLGGPFTDHDHVPDLAFWSTPDALGVFLWLDRYANNATTLYAASLCPG